MYEQEEPQELLTADIFQEISELIPGYAIFTKSKQKTFKNDPKKLHNYICQQIVDLLISIKEMVTDEQIQQLFAEKCDDEATEQSSNVKDRFNDLLSILNGIKTQLQPDPKIKDHKTTYQQIVNMKNSLQDQYKALAPELKKVPKIQQYINSLDVVLVHSFNLLQEMITKYEESNQNLIKKIDQFDDNFFSKFMEFADEQNANKVQKELTEQEQQAVNVAQIIKNYQIDMQVTFDKLMGSMTNQAQEIEFLYTPKIRLEDIIKIELEEEKVNSENDPQSELKSIQSLVADAFKYAFSQEIDLVDGLNEEKEFLMQHLKDRDANRDRNFKTYCQQMTEVVNNLMSQLTFENPEDEAKAKAYTTDLLQKLNPQQYDVTMQIIDQAVVSIFNQMNNPPIPAVDRPILTMTTDPKQIILTNELTDKGFGHCTIMRLNNGEIIIGGNNKKLFKYSPDFELIKTADTLGEIKTGLAVGKKLYCRIGINKQLSIFDSESLNFQANINLQENALKILQIDKDFLMVGEYDGCIDIIRMSKKLSVFKAQISSMAQINEVIATNTPSEYAFATNLGIVFGILDQDNKNNFKFNQNLLERYFIEKRVYCVAMAQENLVIAGVYQMNKLQIINRESKLVIKEVGSFDGFYNCLMQVVNFCEEEYPYLLLKDKSNIAVINTKTFECSTIMPCKYDYYSLKYSFLQYEQDNQLKIITLFYDANSEARSIKEFIIAQAE